MNGAKCTNPQWKEQGLNSENFVAFNLTERIQLIGGTWYGGEMKKGMFSVMNYLLPLKGIASMHCSANVGEKVMWQSSLACPVPVKQRCPPITETPPDWR